MAYKTLYRLFLSLGVLTAPVACNVPPAPVERPSETQGAAEEQVPSPPLARAARSAADAASRQAGRHFVLGGDTLYSIAWQHNLDYRALIVWNRIEAPYTIYPGQRLRLLPPEEFMPSPPLPGERRAPQKPDAGPAPAIAAKRVTPPLVAKPPAGPGPDLQTRPSPPSAGKPAARQQEVNALLRWDWPTEGKLLKLKSPTAERGLQISGVHGQDVFASCSGDVVYSGSGLLGYGKLIIIKHSDEFLSAYAHNSELLVVEGDQVVVGQLIARMGRGVDGSPILHFEIRKNGKSADPLKYLPDRRA